MKKTGFPCWLFLFLFSGLPVFAFSGKTPDSLKAIQSGNSRPAALENFILKNYIQDPALAFSRARQLTDLPGEQLSTRSKIKFLKELSQKFARQNNYKYAFLTLQLADSLKTHLPSLSGKSQTQKARLPAGFWLFLLTLLTGTGWILSLYLKTRKITLALKKAMAETKQLQTEIKKAEQEMQEKLEKQTAGLRKTLEELHNREVALKTKLKKTEEANYLRNAFIANLGFDVRTPLSGIIGFANMLETELAVKENRELYDYAASIEKSGSRLLKLLDNVIDLSALESNRLVLKIKPVAPEKVMRKVHEQYKPVAINKNLIFKIKTEKDLNTVLADENGLEKALSQIVDNAIKYTETGFVTMTASYSEETDTDVFEIKDNGPGIPPEKQDALFQIRSSGETVEGTGIGLRLAKKYIEMMKGRLFLESTPGKGTTVTIHLPCSEEAVVEETVPTGKITEREVTTAAELGELDIFVVEDDRMNRIILEKMLKPLGKVKLTVDGDDCLTTVETEAQKGHFYQIMLFDINLPGEWDGIKLLKVIREKYPEYRKVPFIAQTAYAMAGDKERLLKEGFDSYLAKPIDKNELISTIKQQLHIFMDKKAS